MPLHLFYIQDLLTLGGTPEPGTNNYLSPVSTGGYYLRRIHSAIILDHDLYLNQIKSLLSQKATAL